MMGRRERGQGRFFYAFDLDKVVPADHLASQIDGVRNAARLFGMRAKGRASPGRWTKGRHARTRAR